MYVFILRQSRQSQSQVVSSSNDGSKVVVVTVVVVLVLVVSAPGKLGPTSVYMSCVRKYGGN